MRKKMTYDTWIEQYKPIKNNIDTNASFDGCMFETFGDEVMFVKAQEERKIWTIVEAEGKLYLSSGYHFVNRIGYFISEVPFEGDVLDIKIG